MTFTIYDSCIFGGSCKCFMRVEKAYFASTTKGHRHRSSRVQLNLPFPTGK